MNKPAEVNIGQIIYNNAYGPYEIIEDLGSIDRVHYINIRFLNKNMFGFNTVKTVRLFNIGNNILDQYQPTICNNTCCLGTLPCPVRPTLLREHYAWSNLNRRCSDITYHSYSTYGGAGYYVDLRWRCFEYFLEDLPKIPNYDLWLNNPGEYDIDKDFAQFGSDIKVYSLATVMFIPKKVNIAEACNRKYTNENGYKGLHKTDGGNFGCEFRHATYGTYTDPIAAASMYNHLARYNGYGDYSNNLLNNLGDVELPIYKIISDEHRVKPSRKNGKYNMYKLMNKDEGNVIAGDIYSKQ